MDLACPGSRTSTSAHSAEEQVPCSLPKQNWKLKGKCKLSSTGSWKNATERSEVANQKSRSKTSEQSELVVYRKVWGYARAKGVPPSSKIYHLLIGVNYE